MDNHMTQPDELRIDALFQPGHTLAWEFLLRYAWLWEALPDIGDYINECGTALNISEYDTPCDSVWIHKTATVAPSAYIGSNVIICAGANVRHCAYIRGNALVGVNALVGNSTELKNAILFDGAQVPHFNYVGDSILGYKSHLGAGAITSNVKSDHSPVCVICGDTRICTDLKKFGAILGDFVEIGCNSVLNPGSIIGSHATVYPLSMVRGYVPSGFIYKRRGEIAKKS